MLPDQQQRRSPPGRSDATREQITAAARRNPHWHPHVDAPRRIIMQTEFTCPTTGASLAFELQSDEDSVVQLWMHSLRIECPVCAGVHETEYRDVYLTGLMAQFRCIPADVKQARIH
jgi:hypothetical protein